MTTITIRLEDDVVRFVEESARREHKSASEWVQEHVTSEVDRAKRSATVPNLGYRVLEVLDGFVDQVTDGVAYVTLRSQFGDVLHGEYPADELNRRGIQEGRGFRCMTIEANGKVSANIEAIPERKLTPQEQLALFDEADKRLGDFEWDE